MTFKLLYTSDLHGNEEFYKRLLKKAEEENINAVVIGGDLCDRNGNTIQERINNQKFFLEKCGFKAVTKQFNMWKVTHINMDYVIKK